MTQVRVSASTYERLVQLKTGMDTFDDVIRRVLDLREGYLQLLRNQGGAKKGKAD